MKNAPNKSVVATADNIASSLRSGRQISSVPHFLRWPKNMNLKSKAEDVLEPILKRPAMYFGEGQDYLWCLNAFLFGYETGFRNGSGSTEEDHWILPEGLHTFIVSRLGEDKARPAWIYRVVDTTDTPEEAWDLFKRLYTEFKQRGRQDSDGKPDTATS